MNEYFLRLKWLINDKADGNVSYFAKLANIPRPTIQSYLNKKMPTAQYLIKIRKNFGVNLNWLLTGEGEPYDKNGSLLWQVIELVEQWLFENSNRYKIMPIHKIEIFKYIYNDHIEKNKKPTIESVGKTLKLIVWNY